MSVRYVGLTALDQVTLSVRRDEICGLIGPNGAGKTTLLNVLSGFQKPSAGDTYLGERRISRRPPSWRARRGVARTFQGVRLFGRFTVFENVQVAALATGAGRKEARSRAMEALELVGLVERADHVAMSLPQGSERLVGLARALASKPAFLLLDEPAAGLDETESQELADHLRLAKDRFGLGVLLVEHDTTLVLGVCDRIYVLEYGRTIAEGPPDVVASDPRVISAYLGSGKTTSDATRG